MASVESGQSGAIDFTSTPPHACVLPRETRELLALAPGQFAVDCTLGAGGHAEDLLRAVTPGGLLLGLDVDPDALSLAGGRLEPLAQNLGVRLVLARANFRGLPTVLAEHAAGRAPNAILADLGVSSMQFDRPERGFSFRHDAPLDMRMDPALPETAADLLRSRSEQELADLIFHLAGEHGARRIARRIVESRERGEPVETTGQLEHLVRRALKVRGHRRIHPATKTFQALRLAVNQELECLAAFLDAAPETLAPNGTMAVISFHSGEDRLVKHRYKALASTGRFLLTGKSVMRPSEDECRANPRSRSAKLRGLRRV